MFSVEKDVERYEELLDQGAKGFQSLMVLHGAGLAGCLSVLKDYATTASYKGVGLLITLFGIGLVVSLSGYLNVYLMRFELLHFTLSKEKRKRWPSVAALIAAMVSVGVVGIAIMLIVVKFGRL